MDISRYLRGKNPEEDYSVVIVLLCFFKKMYWGLEKFQYMTAEEKKIED